MASLVLQTVVPFWPLRFDEARCILVRSLDLFGGGCCLGGGVSCISLYILHILLRIYGNSYGHGPNPLILKISKGNMILCDMTYRAMTQGKICESRKNHLREDSSDGKVVVIIDQSTGTHRGSGYTPKFNRNRSKNRLAPKRKLIFQPSFFRGYVNFRARGVFHLLSEVDNLSSFAQTPEKKSPSWRDFYVSCPFERRSCSK